MHGDGDGQDCRELDGDRGVGGCRDLVFVLCFNTCVLCCFTVKHSNDLKTENHKPSNWHYSSDIFYI